MPYYSRKPTRLPGYDYSNTNFYFVTICTYEKKCLFGKPDQLNTFGKIAEADLAGLCSHYKGVQVICFVIMPNHVHAIISLEDTDIPLDKVIGLYKSGVSRKIRRLSPNIQVWQRSFHDHVIRNQSSYEKIWNYVTFNAQKWETDCFYPGAQVAEAREGQDPPLR